MSDKRIIEEPASEEIFHDDWLVKDSPLNETTKIKASVFMALVVDAAKEGMVPYIMLATEWTALTTYYKDQVVIYNGELYRAKDTNVSPTFNPSAWTKVSFDTLYRTTLADVKNSICEEWSTSTTYTLNDCAIHEDKLYKCVADTATVGTWVSSEWELVSIYEMIQNLPKSASDVTYDNTESGLESDNVQDALDEVVETITELSNTTEVTGTASGAIATFSDGADAPLKDLKVTVTPQQDLHGYDAPWAGGAGKNKFDWDAWKGVTVTRGTAVYENNGVTITATDDNAYTWCNKYCIIYALYAVDGIETENISGYAKGSGYVPGESYHTNHDWNAIKLRNKWYLLDITWGEGHSIHNKYVKEFNPFYFCTPPKYFIYQHFPNEEKWQLLDKPISEKEYIDMINYKDNFFTYGFTEIIPNKSVVNINNNQYNMKVYFEKNENLRLKINLYFENNKDENIGKENCIIDKKDNYFDVIFNLPQKGLYNVKLYGSNSENKYHIKYNDIAKFIIEYN